MDAGHDPAACAARMVADHGSPDAAVVIPADQSLADCAVAIAVHDSAGCVVATPADQSLADCAVAMDAVADS